LTIQVKCILNENCLGAVKKGAAKQCRINRISGWHLTWLVRTKTDIKMRTSRLGILPWLIYENNWWEQGLISSCGQVDAVLPMLFVASYSYNKTRTNTHLTVIKLSFGHFLI